MENGDKVRTPRFGIVEIDRVFDTQFEAIKAGYTEPTHYHKGGFGVYGKHLDTNGNGWVRFSFAACREWRQD